MSDKKKDPDSRPPFIQALEDEAYEQLAAIREARIYSGSNPDFRLRAKQALGVIGGYVRLRATMANERSNELMTMRILGSGAAKALSSGE